MSTTSAMHAAAILYAAAIVGGIALVGVAVLIFFWARRGSRRRVMVTIGCVVIAIALLGGFIAEHAIAQQRKVSNWEASLTRLGFPLELPSVPGYYPMGGYTGADGSLEIDMGRDGPAMPKTSVLTVSFYGVSDGEGATVLRMCTQAADRRFKSQLTCQAEGASVWRVTEPGMPYDEILARRQDMIVVAREEPSAQLPESVLVRAVSSLRAATAAQIAALPSTNAG